jgi:hypothetical protein
LTDKFTDLPVEAEQARQRIEARWIAGRGDDVIAREGLAMSALRRMVLQKPFWVGNENP